MRSFYVFVLSLFVAGCVAVQPPAPLSSSKPPGVCYHDAGYHKDDHSYVRSGYVCTESAFKASSNTASCSWVEAHLRSDGVMVDAHFRCDSDLGGPLVAPSAVVESPKSCVNSYCGPVSVRGYYRKDGTYVRPHTRKRPKR